MHEIYELKEMLMKELEEYGRKGELTGGSLEIVDKLAHAIKNLCKIIEAEEGDEYSMAGGGSYRGGGSNRGGSNRGSYRGGGSNRGGSYEGSYARRRRDSMGRYSREGGYSREGDVEEIVESIREMMQELPPEIQREAQQFVAKLEQQM